MRKFLKRYFQKLTLGRKPAERRQRTITFLTQEEIRSLFRVIKYKRDPAQVVPV